MADSPFDPEKGPDVDFFVPDLVECVEGWRAWKVKTDLPKFNAAPKLESVSHDFHWPPRQHGIVTCEKCGDDAPGESHNCGFYSAKDLEHLVGMGYQQYDAEHGTWGVIGQIANWGKVIEGTQGWRSQKAYPVKLFVPYEAWRLCKPLSEAFGIPVTLLNFLKPYTEFENLEAIMGNADKDKE